MTQRTWNVGETVKGKDYLYMPAGVFVRDGSSTRAPWVASTDDGMVDSYGKRCGRDGFFAPRLIIPRPANAPAHIPVYMEHVHASVDDQIRMLDKIKAEAEALIAERDALKQDLRKARDACKKLREERDEARKMACAYTPAPRFKVGQIISTREEYEALPVGSTVWPDDCTRTTAPSFYWTKTDVTSEYTSRSGMRMHLGGYGREIRSLP